MVISILLLTAVSQLMQTVAIIQKTAEKEKDPHCYDITNRIIEMRIKKDNQYNQ